MISVNTRFNRVCFILINLLYVTHLAAVEMSPANHVGYYIQQYGQITPENDAQVKTTYAIFKRVTAVADKSKKRFPKLVVVNSNAEPWAIALPDGHIILSKQAIQICHVQIKPTDACLAFILGHELAHLANDDFWHQEVYSFLTTQRQTQSIAHFLKNNALSIKAELAADDKGFIYAALAGYPVNQLIDTHINKPNFFELWMLLTNSRLINPEITNNRASPLIQRLKEIKNQLAFYEFGVRLSHFGHCDDAIFFFKTFQKIFPGREILNNIGYCYLQTALQQMDANQALFYWFPTVLDLDYPALSFSRNGKTFSSLQQAAKRQTFNDLDNAIQYLKQAVEVDTFYIPAKINLAVALLLAGKPIEARVYIQQIKRTQPNHLHYHQLDALALYEQSDAEIDYWPIAIKKLQKQLENTSVNQSYILFNLARLYELREKSAESLVTWQQLTHQTESLPPAIQSIACSKQSSLSFAECQQSQHFLPKKPLDFKQPIHQKSLQTITATQSNQLSTWNQLAFDWYQDDLYGQIYTHPENHSQVLVLGQFIQMQVLKNLPPVGMDKIQSTCSITVNQQQFAGGNIYTCPDDWSLLVRNDEIQEAWWLAK